MGGIDADEGADLDSCSDSYSSLLNYSIRVNWRIIVPGLLPRNSVDLEPYNECLKTLCDAQDIDVVDHYNGFLFASGDIADSNFHKDKLHSNSFGTRKLLRNLYAVHRVTSPDTQSKPAGPVRRNS